MRSGPRGAGEGEAVTDYLITFDGSTEPGTVVLSDGLIEARATFATDHDARLFFGLLNELRARTQTAELRLGDLSAAARRLASQAERYEEKP